MVAGVARRGGRVRALGTRHSFNDVADSRDALLSMEGLDGVAGLDGEAMTVTVEGGIRYGVLARYLDGEGLALHNLASLPHISVGGSVATGTHGSGVRNGSLATQVVGLEIVRGDGGTVRLSREGDPDVFAGAVVSLGALGPAVRLTLRVEQSFEVAQTVYEGLAFDTGVSRYEEIASAGYSVSLFTHWAGEGFEQVWVKRRADRGGGGFPEAFFGARRADGPRHPVPGMSPVNTTEQGGVPGPWSERLAHFRLGFTPSSGEELQSEWMVPRRLAPEALSALSGIAPRIAPLLYVSEVRTMAGDDLWLSGGYGEDATCLHFTWKPLGAEVAAVLPVVEEALAPFGARPHWGKLFAMGGDRVRSAFPRFGDFVGLAGRFDPGGVFQNPFLARLGIGG